MIPKTCTVCFRPFLCRTDQHKRGDGQTCSYKCRNTSRTRPIEDRYWEHVIKNPAGCWGWRGSTHEHGYGVLNVNGTPKGAHRISYEIHYGPPPSDKPNILHHCDNPPCSRPDHLFAGTDKENSQDMVAKRRHYFGERNHLSRLTEKRVKEMRRLYATGNWSQTRLANRYGVHASTVSYAVRGITWK